MRQKRVAATLVVAGIGLAALAAFAATQANRQTTGPGFDPRFATGAGAICAPLQGGRPPLLDRLVLAQAETKPFTPGRQLPGKASAATPPLFSDLGTLHVPITTSNAKAQAYFDQGMRLAFSFNHAEAARAFRAAQQLDPVCGMCYWGEALVLGPNINAPMFPEAAAPAAAAAAKATSLAARGTPTEQMLIRAVTRRYSASPPDDRAPLDKAYADAMAEAANAFPNDDTVQVLFAESLMDLSPWDYWQAAGSKPKGRTAEMVAALETVLKRNPTHPGAAHYYIHAMEASTSPQKALPAARVLAQQIPGAGHVVHMPSHIYYRVGMFKESLQSNIDAIAVDEKYFSKSDSDPVYKGAYYPHNIHFLMVSALMGGDGKTALEAAAKLDKSLAPELVKAFAVMQPVKAAPYFSHVQFSSPDVLVALPDPGPDFVLVKAMWHYARAIGFARKGAIANSQKEIDAIAAIERTGDFKAITDWAVPAREIVQTARAVASGRLADAKGDRSAAIEFYQAAVAIQDALPYTEPPYWYYPVRQSLGAALLRAGQLDTAEQAFLASLARTPGNGWALRGLIEIYRKRGDTAALAAAKQRYDATWLGKPGGPELSLL